MGTWKVALTNFGTSLDRDWFNAADFPQTSPMSCDCGLKGYYPHLQVVGEIGRGGSESKKGKGKRKLKFESGVK